MKNVVCNWWGKTQWDCPKPASVDAKSQNRSFNISLEHSVKIWVTYVSIVKRIRSLSYKIYFNFKIVS